MSRILAVDYGERRVGLAVSDETGTIATGLETLDRRKYKSDQALAAEIARLAGEYAAVMIVVGLPLNMDGTSGEAAARVVGFTEILGCTTGAGVATWDERLTTAAALRTRRELGLQLKKRRDKKEIDRLSAVILLQNYLAYQRQSRKPDV
ncbi:MAG: Holliday junction resolvase RuvX [Candidatus Glassbacteria bacterium]|nr:Holliday junction resolvase RuvX [Candidatus Glassbacteria bacterium]